MEKSKYIVIFLLLSFINLFAQANRYEMKSGIVEYEIVGKGESAVTGTSKLYFKDFGNVELSDERIIQTIMGDKEEERVVSKIVGDKVFTVDFTDEVIYTQKIVADEENSTMNIKNREAFISMGAKNLGTEEILGYKCDIWKLGEDKIWVHNSVPLKLISKSLGVEQVQVAKFVVFNIDIKDEKFKLPPFPVKAMEELISVPDSDSSPEQERMVNEMMKQTEKPYIKQK